MRDNPPPLPSRAPFSECQLWYLALGRRRFGFFSLPPTPPRLRSFQSRLSGCIWFADPPDALEPRECQAHRGISAAEGTGGSAQKVFPATASATAQAIVPGSGPEAGH